MLRTYDIDLQLSLQLTCSASACIGIAMTLWRSSTPCSKNQSPRVCLKHDGIDGTNKYR